jgi:peptidyl-prolyl cis-trans isomerase D
MSIIQNIRERGTWIILGFIAIALIAFILQDGIGRNKGSNELSILGTINGQEINKMDFDKKVQNILADHRNPYKLILFQEQLSEQERGQYYNQNNLKREQIVNFAWDEEANFTLISQEAEKIGLAVGNKEIEDIIYGNESPFLFFPNGQTEEQYLVKNTDNNGNLINKTINKQGLTTYLNQLKKSNKKELVDQREAIEKFEITPAIKYRLYRKYQNLLIKGVQTPKWLLDKQFAENNAISNINYVYVPFTSIPNSNIKVTNDDINAYLNENKAAYQIDELQRNISIVKFNATASAQDSTVARNSINELKISFKTTTDIGSFINNKGTNNNYDSAYYSKKIWRLPNLDSIIKNQVGEVYGPYIDGNNYTITKLVGTKQWPDTVSFRHITITDTAAARVLDTIQLALKGGALFEELAKKYSKSQDAQVGGVVNDFTQEFQLNQGAPRVLLNYVFDNATGTKGTIKTEYGYEYVEILKQTPRQAVYNLAQLSKPIMPSNETIAKAREGATSFATNSKDQNSFTTNANKLGKQVIPIIGVKNYDFGVNQIGEKRELVKWVFEKNINTVSDPYEVGDNFIVAVITGEDKPGLASVETAKTTNRQGQPGIEDLIRNKKKAEQLKPKLKGAKLEAIATANSLQVQKQDSISYNNYNQFSAIGFEPKLMGAAFNKSLLNKVSEPIEGNTGVFTISVSSLGATPAQIDVNTFKAQIDNDQSRTMRSAYLALKKTAKIIDNRGKLF